MLRSGTGGPLTTTVRVVVLLPAGLVTSSEIVEVPTGSVWVGGACPLNVAPPGKVHVQLVGSPVEVSANWTRLPASWVAAEVRDGLGVDVERRLGVGGLGQHGVVVGRVQQRAVVAGRRERDRHGVVGGRSDDDVRAASTIVHDQCVPVLAVSCIVRADCCWTEIAGGGRRRCRRAGEDETRGKRADHSGTCGPEQCKRPWSRARRPVPSSTERMARRRVHARGRLCDDRAPTAWRAQRRPAPLVPSGAVPS